MTETLKICVSGLSNMVPKYCTENCFKIFTVLLYFKY